MSLSRTAVLCVIGVTLAVSTSASRDLQQVPSFQGSGLSIINSNDPSAREQAQPTPTPTLASTFGPVVAPSEGGSGLTLPPTAQPPAAKAPASQPPAGTLPIFAPAPSTTAQTTPAQAPLAPPAQAPTQPPLPVVQVPAPAPATVLPIVQVPVPAPYTAPPTVLPTVPSPAPATVPQAPAPAPQYGLPAFVNTLAPAPEPVPAPGPVNPYPDCGVRPQCRLFVEDMLCCENAGALTSKQHAVMRLQCTHPVNYYPKCFNVTGPTNITTFDQFDTTTWSQTHVAQASILDDFMGNVTIDIEGPRTNANLSADCGLYVSPCMFEGEVIKTVLPVQGLSFTTIPTEDFMEISNSVDDDINNLDSLVFVSAMQPATCQQQNIGDLDSSFFMRDWITYSGGFQQQCNYTAFVDAVAPLSPPSSSVQTSSLGQ